MIFPWIDYTKKLKEKVVSPMHVGIFTAEEAKAAQARLVIGEEGSLEEGCKLKLYLLVQLSDGVIARACFQAMGETLFIAAADALCELIHHKNHGQAARISAELVDKKLRDDPAASVFSEENYRFVNLALSALMEALMQCQDIPITDPYSISTVMEGRDTSQSSHHIAAWPSYSLEDKLHLIRETITREIAPYIALDAGGVEVQELKNDREVIVIYQGTCTSCFSATGATLNAIQQILRDKVHPELIVTPDASVLKF